MADLTSYDPDTGKVIYVAGWSTTAIEIIGDEDFTKAFSPPNQHNCAVPDPYIWPHDNRFMCMDCTEIWKIELRATYSDDVERVWKRLGYLAKEVSPVAPPTIFDEIGNFGDVT